MLVVSGSSVIQKGSSLGTEWQTPVISEAFRSRFSRCSSVADSGDTAIGTSCSDIAEGKFELMIWLPKYVVVFKLYFRCIVISRIFISQFTQNLLDSSYAILVTTGPFLSTSAICPAWTAS